MNALVNPRRGIISPIFANNPNSWMADITAAFADFKAKHKNETAGLNAAIDDLNCKVASLAIGAGGAAPQSSGRARAALQNLGNFGRNGRAEALTEGFRVNAAMSVDSDPNGGYLAPDELSTELMRIQTNDSAMRRIARVVSTNSGAFMQPFTIGGTGSGWVSERQARPETEAFKLALIDVPAGEIYANPAITQNLLDDNAYDLGSYLATEIADGFNDQEGAAFITGDGVNKPKGFLAYTIVTAADATRAFGQLQYVPSKVAAALSDNSHNGGDVLIDLVYTLKAKYRANARWLMNSATAGIVRKLKDGEDRYLWQQALTEGQPSLLLGYPVEIDEGMPDIGADKFPIAFGDFLRGYLITDRQGVRILRDPFSNKPYVHFYSTKRVGGGLLDSNAIKLLKIAAT